MGWRLIREALVCAALGLQLAACAPPENGRAAARVNGVPILDEEIALLRRHGGAELEGVPERQLIEDLVVKELLAQQFLRTTRGSAGIADSAVSVARRELLARRHVAALAAAVTPPGEEEVRAYYRAHPELYAGRRAFLVRAVDIVVPPPRTSEVLARVRAAPTFDALMAWLRRTDLRFAWSEAEHTSDELAADALARLGAMRRGEVAVRATPRGLRVIQLVHARPAALDEHAARPLIEQRLIAQRRAAALNEEIDRLARLAAISIGDGKTPEATGTPAWRPPEWPAVISSPGPHGPVTGGAPGGGDAQ